MIAEALMEKPVRIQKYLEESNVIASFPELPILRKQKLRIRINSGRCSAHKKRQRRGHQ
jgi:hypothetical protein